MSAALPYGGSLACGIGSSMSARLDNGQTGRGTGVMSLKNSVEKDFDRNFAERFGHFLRLNFTNPTQVAACFGVRERTAENWWNGLNAPSGWQVAKVFLTWPDAARETLGGECGLQSDGGGGRSVSS